jgi:hypothetical protein
MIPWTTIEDAFSAWIRAATGLPDARVVWAQQAMPRPAAPYITMRITSLRRIGQDWLQVFDNPAPTPGNEIIHSSLGQREGTITLQAFGPAATGASSPAALLQAAVAGANLQSRRDALNTAGIGLAGFGPVQSIDGTLGSSVFEPRAIVEARFFLAEETQETGTFIEFVELENLTAGQSTYVPEDPDP